MKSITAAACCLLMMSIVPATLSAKGRTVKITITGTDLPKPIEITDEKIGMFSIWAGPGVVKNGVEETEGFIIDWSKGVVAQPPAGLRHYVVSFYDGCRMDEDGCRTSEPLLIYVVSYDYNPSTEQGFVYLPGKADKLVKFNKIWHGHGFEGNWLFATNTWESFVRPLIAKARAAGAN